MRRPTTEDREAIDILMNSQQMNVWEDDFVCSLRQQADDGKIWTEKQAAKFDEVWERVMG